MEIFMVVLNTYLIIFLSQMCSIIGKIMKSYQRGTNLRSVRTCVNAQVKFVVPLYHNKLIMFLIH
jgi:hypothetical protein